MKIPRPKKFRLSRDLRAAYKKLENILKDKRHAILILAVVCISLIPRVAEKTKSNLKFEMRAPAQAADSERVASRPQTQDSTSGPGISREPSVIDKLATYAEKYTKGRRSTSWCAYFVRHMLAAVGWTPCDISLGAYASIIGPNLKKYGFENEISKYVQDGKVNYNKIPDGAVLVYGDKPGDAQLKIGKYFYSDFRSRNARITDFPAVDNPNNQWVPIRGPANKRIKRRLIGVWIKRTGKYKQCDHRPRK